MSPKTSARLWSALAMALLAAISACAADDLSTRLTGRVPVKVRMWSDFTGHVPMPVFDDQLRIGEAVRVETAQDGSTILSLALDSGQRDRLRDASVFYVASDERGERFVHEVIREGSPPKQGDLVFIGFNSYTEYLLWRTGNIARDRLNEFLKGLEDALKAPKKPEGYTF